MNSGIFGQIFSASSWPNVKNKDSFEVVMAKIQPVQFLSAMTVILDAFLIFESDHLTG